MCSVFVALVLQGKMHIAAAKVHVVDISFLFLVFLRWGDWLVLDAECWMQVKLC